MAVAYDIVLSTPFPNYHFFAHRMRELCGQLNLTFFMADKVWVSDFLRKLEQKEIGVRMLLDLKELCHRLPPSVTSPLDRGGPPAAPVVFPPLPIPHTKSRPSPAHQHSSGV